MAVRIPDHVVGGTYAIGAVLTDGPVGVLTLDFFVQDAGAGEEERVVVQRVRLNSDSIEPLYVELGAVLQRHREAAGDS